MQNQDFPKDDNGAVSQSTLTFSRRPWLTGAGYVLIYIHEAEGVAKPVEFADENEADAYGHAHNCVVTHRVILTEAQQRQADRDACTRFRAGKMSYGAARNRYAVS